MKVEDFPAELTEYAAAAAYNPQSIGAMEISKLGYHRLGPTGADCEWEKVL